MLRRFVILGFCSALLVGGLAPKAVGQTANLGVTLSASATSMTLGSNVTYTLVVTNFGPDTASAVRATNSVPPNFSIVSANINVSGLATQSVNLIATNRQWRYDDTGADRGTAWVAPGYDDSGWLVGAGALALEDPAQHRIPVSTVLRMTNAATVPNKFITHYFRTAFTNAVASTNANLRLYYQVDDALVMYLNGVEIHRFNIADGPVTAATTAITGFGEGTLITTNVTVTNLLAGTNVFAVEVHQNNNTSSDVYFGLSVDAVTSSGPVAGYTIENGTNVIFTVDALPARAGAVATVVARSTASGSYFTRAYVGSATPDTIMGNNTAQVAANVLAPTPANLSLTLTDFPDPIQVSNLLTYTLTVYNAGPLAAANATLTNTMPDGMEFVSATISNAGIVTQLVQFLSFSNVWKFDDSNVDLGTNWIRPEFDDSQWASGPGLLGEESAVLPYPIQTPLNLANGSIPTYYFRSTFEYAGGVTNPILMRLLQDDGLVVYLNGKEIHRTNMPAGAVNFSTSASSSSTNFSEGKILVSTHTLTNLVVGTNTLAVEVHQSGTNSSDILFGMELSEAISTSGAYEVAGQDVIFRLGSVPSLSTVQIAMVARPGLAGLQTNTAVVASSVYDNNLTNNTATTTTLVASGPVGADLSVTVTDHPDPIIQGQNVTYTVTVRNAGPAPAANTKVTNTFSAAIAEVNLGPGCVLVGNTVICSLGTVATNGQKTVSFTVQALEAGTLTNGVLAWSDEVDASPANNTAVATTVVETSLRADLGVSVQDFPDPVIAGGMFTNVITLTNPGWSNAPNVMLTNRLTGPLAIQNIRVGAGVGYTNLGGGVVVFALGTLPAGSNAVVVIEALALGVGGATNAATVGTDILDPNPANNYSLTLTRINPTPVADLVTTITATPESAYGTFPLLYAIKVENAGTLAAGGVVLTNWIPSQVTVTGITNRHGSYTNQGKLLVCQLGTLPVGGSATVLVQVVTPPEGSLTNLAVAFAPQNDYNAADNLATLTTVVVPVTAADLSLGATVQSSNLYAGDEMTVRLSLVNNGPLGATGVVITNYPPAGTTFLRGTVTRGSLSFTTNAVVITVGSLTNGGSVQASLVMRANRDGALTNLAVARGGQPDPTPNAVATVIQVRPSADVRVSVVESADPVPSQGVLVYTITAFNAGPSTASNATIYCSLPPTAQFKGSFPVAGVSSGNGLVLWNAGPIASGGSVTLAVNITPGEVSQINVPMGVYSDARDPVATNNSVVVQTTVSVSLAGSSITVTPNDSAMALAAALTGPDVVGIRINDATLLGHSLPGGEGEEDALSSGVFNSTSIYGSGQNLSGVILSTGDVADYASGPNSKPDNGTAYDQAADSDQENFLDPITSGEEPGFDHFDVTQFDLNFDVLPGYDRITFKVVFGSEEFPASESRTFADGFGVYLDYRNIATPGGSAITSAHPDMAERAGTELNGVLVEDGSQVVMTFTAPVVPGTTGHRLTFILGDTSDADLDSTVYISSLQGLPGAKADVTLGATAAPEPASVGAPLTYTLLATNLGPGAASGTVLTGQLPDIFTNVTATVPPGSTYTYNKGVFTWNVGSLAAQGGAVATLTGKPRMEARVLADFAIQAGSVDSNTNNNKVQVFSTVAGTGSFYSPSALTIRDGAAALPYPSSITIFGLTGVVDTVTVSLLGLYHSFPADVQAMVMSPDGRAVLLMAGAGGGQDAQSVTLQFADSATNSLPLDEPLASGSFKPTNLAANNQFPGFTPQTMPPLAGELAHFRRANPNGDWRLYLYDAQGGDAGQLAGGWNIKLTTVPEMTLAVAGSNSVISWQDMPGYTLEGTAVLSSNPAWTTVTQNQVVANGRRTVVVPMSSGLKFFRLRQ